MEKRLCKNGVALVLSVFVSFFLLVINLTS